MTVKKRNPHKTHGPAVQSNQYSQSVVALETVKIRDRLAQFDVDNLERTSGHREKTFLITSDILTCCVMYFFDGSPCHRGSCNPGAVSAPHFLSVNSLQTTGEFPS